MQREDKRRTDGETRTLGDLLYADNTRARVSEQDWAGLVQRIAAGDQRALHALYERTHRIVFTLIMRIVNSRETAEEVTVDVFRDVWRRAGTYDAAGGPVVGWIMNQARSRAIDRLRFEHRKKRISHDDSADSSSSVAAASAGDPREAFDARESVSRYLVLATRDALDGGPDVAKLRAFVARAGQGVTYAMGTWHHPVTVLDAPASFAVLMWRDGSAGDEAFVPVTIPLTVDAT